MSSTIPAHPLLVKVQTIDIHSLDFKTSGTFKPRNVTCVEASNLFIFVGVTSGTVYVFSRESLAFKFMIPFKGGKVCCISCAENERDLAIGSIRGQVSVYQLIEQSLQPQTPSVSAPVAFFKYVHTIEHHKGNEITELHWSPNGRYLFIGDNQGLVSQANVGSWEDFPGSASMSEVILKLKSRIIQVQLLFPFLGVCTISAVFLCDVENEDFTRIQFESKEDIHASGLALVMSHGETSAKTLTIHLYVSDMTSGLLHCFNLQGQLVRSQKIEMNSFLTRNPVSSFHPIRDETIEEYPNKVGSDDGTTTPNVALGKLFVTDDNLIISVSHNHLYFIEPKKMELLFWNDEFHKIRNAKLISNYVFLWSSTKVHVLSLTQVLPYAEQLFRAGISLAFERWIQYCLLSIGWNENESDSEINQTVAKHFRFLFHLKGSWDEENPFNKFISLRVPFDVSTPEEILDESSKSHLWKPLQKLLAVFAESAENQPSQLCSKELAGIQDFYSAMNLNALPSSDGTNLGLLQVMLNLEALSLEMNLFNLYKELSDISCNNEIQILNERILLFLKGQQTLAFDYISFLGNSPDEMTKSPNLRIFSTFVDQDEVMDWFGDFGTSKAKLFQDALLADLVLLLIPFLSPDAREEILTGFQQTFHGFCMWLLTSTFYNLGEKFPYEFQLKSLFNTCSNTLQFSYAKDMLCSIYRDLVHSDIQPLYTSLHHIISIFFFITDEEQVGSPKKEILLTLLISCFPCKHWTKKEIEAKLTTLCQKNGVLFQMFQEASLFYHRETQLCRCGIPLNSSQPTPTSDPGISSILVTAKEVVLELLLQKHYHSLTLDPGMEPSLPQSFLFKFSMKTNLLEQFLNEFSHNLSDGMLMEILVRVSSCAFLGKIQMTKSRLKSLLWKREYILEHKRCESCGESLVLPEDFTSLSMDCIGICLLNNSSSLEAFRKTVELTPGLNAPGTFSLAFYQLVSAWWTKGNGIGSLTRSSTGRGPSGTNKICCDTLHDLTTDSGK